MATSLGLLFGSGEEEDALAKLLRAQSPGLAAQSERQAALQAAAALLQAGGPSRTPVSLGQALGGALQAGQQGYQAAQQQGLQRLILNQQLQQMQQQQLREKSLREALTAQPTEEQRFQAGTAAMGAEGMGPTVTAARAQEKAVAAARPFASLTPEQRLIASQMPYAQAVQFIGENVKPEKYGTGTNVGSIGGRPVTYVVGERGSVKVLDVAPQPNEEQIKTGNRIIIRDKNTGKTVGTYDIEMSPAEVATNLRALSAQDLNERQFAYQQQSTNRRLAMEAQGLGLRAQELQQGQQRLAQSDRELVTDASGNMFFVSKTGAPSAVVSGPTGEALKGKGQTIPTAVTEEFIKNQANLNSIQEAYKLVEENPDAVGPITGRIPSGVRDIVAKEEKIKTRAAVARIGSMLIKDISGATVPVAEVPRLAPFIPLATDGDKAIKVKLDGLEREIRNIEEERKRQYTAQGMNYPSLSGTIAIPGAPSLVDKYNLTPRR